MKPTAKRTCDERLADMYEFSFSEGVKVGQEIGYATAVDDVTKELLA